MNKVGVIGQIMPLVQIMPGVKSAYALLYPGIHYDYPDPSHYLRCVN